MFRNASPSQSEVLDLLASCSSLSVEKHEQTGIHSFNRSLSNAVARCEKCDLTELRELCCAVVGDHTLSESGIEDFSSSAGSNVDVGPFQIGEARGVIEKFGKRKCDIGGSVVRGSTTHQDACGSVQHAT
uniref:Saposin B-type domain-containing protein n=1 Tax=Angiostrongylus cantonensis TaxID=6313 RepID=A0A0K0D8D7_ANGCA